MTHDTLSIGRVALLGALALTVGSAAHAQRVVRDSQSGQLRAPTADEAKALESGRASRPVGLVSGKLNPQPVQYADGTVGQELDSSSLMYSVARRNADGSISQYCVNGSEAAERLVKAPTKSGARVTAKAGKEQNYAAK